MKILAVDTSTPFGSVAITDNENIIGEAYLEPNRTHAETILPAIEQLLNDFSLTLKDLDAFAVAIGPGSFTGLRVGLATIKGLAFVIKKPVIGISTLKSLAFNYAGSPNMICPMIDARKAQVYFALYETCEGKRELVLKYPESVKGPKDCGEELLKIINKDKAPIFLGDGAKRYRDILIKTLGKEITIADDKTGNPRAANTGLLALTDLKAGLVANLDLIEPNYIRKSEADLLW